MPAAAVAELRAAADSELARLKARMRKAHAIDVATDEFAFAEVAHRSPLRYDVQLVPPRPRGRTGRVSPTTADALERWVLPADVPDVGAAGTDERHRVVRESVWHRAARAVIGEDAVLHFCGCVTSEPGAIAQSLHVDGEHLARDLARGVAHAPPYAVNVFIPLVDTSLALRNGPTEFLPGTHMASAAAQRSAGAAGAAAPAAAPAHMLRGATRGAEAPALRAGDAVLADYRVVHRGLANSSQSARPLLYLTLAAPGWRDSHNFGAHSVWDRWAVRC